MSTKVVSKIYTLNDIFYFFNQVETLKKENKLLTDEKLVIESTMDRLNAQLIWLIEKYSLTTNEFKVSEFKLFCLK